MSEKQTDFLATIGAVYSDGVTLIFDGQTQPTTKRYKRNKSVTFTPGQRVKVVKISGTYIVEYPVSAQSGGTNPPAGDGEDGDLGLMGDETGGVFVVEVVDLEEGTVNCSVSQILELLSLGRLVVLRWPLGDSGSFKDYYLYQAASDRIEFRSQMGYTEDGSIEVGVVAVYDGNHFYMDQIVINQETEVELVYDWDGVSSLTTAEIYALSCMSKVVVFRDLGTAETEEATSYMLWHSDAKSAEFRSPAFVSDDGALSVKVVSVSEPNVITREEETVKDGSGVPDCTEEDNGKFLQVVDGKPAWVALVNVSEVGM